jgi:hypothetical protein
MHKKSTTRSNGASTSLGGAGGWTDGRRSETVARSLQRGERERERDCCGRGSDSDERKTNGNGVNAASGRPIYRGVI